MMSATIVVGQLRGRSCGKLAPHNSVEESGHIKRWDMTGYLWRSGVGTGMASGTRPENLPLSTLEVVFQEQEPMCSGNICVRPPGDVGETRQMIGDGRR